MQLGFSPDWAKIRYSVVLGIVLPKTVHQLAQNPSTSQNVGLSYLLCLLGQLSIWPIPQFGQTGRGAFWR
jgi:hypothetical protein